MTVKLTKLDIQKHLFYNSVVNVRLCLDKYDIIGSCKVVKNKSGNHLGELNLDLEVSQDLFFYYREMASLDGGYDFSGIDLYEKEIAERPALRLRDMIV